MSQAEKFITSDPKGLVLSFSPQASELFGYSPEEIIGRKRLSTFHKRGALRDLLPRLMKEAQEQGIFREEVDMRRKDGTEFLADLTVRALFEEGDLTGYSVLAHEV